MWWQTLLGVVGGILLIYLTLLAMLWRYSRSHPEAVGMREALRLLPDLLRLLRRLVADPTLPLRVRVQLGLLMAYLVSPIDLIPDFIPVLGYADDVIIVVIVLRSVVRHAGRTRSTVTGPARPPASTCSSNSRAEAREIRSCPAHP